MRLIWKFLKYLIGAIVLWMVIAVGVVSCDIISIRRDINRSVESFGIGESIYEFWVPGGRYLWIRFRSGENADDCLEVMLSRNGLRVDLPEKQNNSQTLENRQDLPSTLQMYREHIRECDTIRITAVGRLTPQGGTFSVYYSDENVTGSTEPIFGD